MEQKKDFPLRILDQKLGNWIILSLNASTINLPSFYQSDYTKRYQTLWKGFNLHDRLALFVPLWRGKSSEADPSPLLFFLYILPCFKIWEPA